MLDEQKLAACLKRNGLLVAVHIASKDALDVKLLVDWTMSSSVRLFGAVGASLASNANSASARVGVQMEW